MVTNTRGKTPAAHPSEPLHESRTGAENRVGCGGTVVYSGNYSADDVFLARTCGANDNELSLVKTTRISRINDFAETSTCWNPVRFLAMIVWLRHLLGWVVSVFRSREDLILENLALRQQLLALHASRPRRRLSAMQELFWLMRTSTT